MESLSKEQREVERNKAYEAMHYACLQAIEILNPDAITGVCSPENVAALIRFKFPEMPITVDFKEVGYMAFLMEYGRQVENPKTKDSVRYIDNHINFVFKSAFFTYNMQADAIAPTYKKLKKALPKYNHTYQLQFFNDAAEVSEYVCTITDKKEFKDIASHAADKGDVLRPIMQGVYIDRSGYMVGSDSHTLKTAKIETSGGVILPIECHKYIIDSKLPSIISISDGKIHITHGDKAKSFKDIGGKYPTWQAVVPKPSGKVAIFDKSQLLDAVKIAGKHCNQASYLIKISIDKTKCIVSAQDIDFGLSCATEIQCNSNTRGEICIKLQHLTKAIKGVPGNQIKFELTDASRCVMINDTCLVMPMLIGDGTNKAEKFELIEGCAVPQLDIIEPKPKKEQKEKKKTAAQLKRDALIQSLAEPTAEPVRYLPAIIYDALPITPSAAPMPTEAPERYLPVPYVKPKKIRKPRKKKNKPTEPQSRQSKELIIFSDAIEQPRPQRAPNRLYNNARKVLQYVAMVVIIFLLQCSPTSTSTQNVDIQHNKIKNKENQKINVNKCLYIKKCMYICNAIEQNTLISPEMARNMSTDNKVKEIAENLVKNEVLANVSSMVEFILANESKDAPFCYDDIETANIYPAYNENGVYFKGGSEDERDEFIENLQNELDELEETEETEKRRESIESAIYDLEQLDPEEREIFEYWICSDYLIRKLADCGEAVIRCENIWCRSCSGQSISMDSVIQQVARYINNA